MGSVALAQETVESINEKTARLTAETARLTAETARLNAAKALAEAQHQPDTRLKEVQARTALENAEKDLADAATSSRIAGSIGTVSNASYSGAVELKDKAGTLEAKLLATKAVGAAAAKICKAVCELVGSRPVLVVAGSSYRSPERLEMYRFRMRVINQTLDNAISQDKQHEGAEVKTAGPAVLSAGLDAAGKLLSFLKSDYTVAGIDANPDELIAVYAVAGALSNANRNVRWPALLMPKQRSDALARILREIRELLDKRNNAERHAIQAAREAAREEKAATVTQNDSEKEQALALAKLNKDRESALRSAIAASDAFVVALTAPVTGSTRDPIADLVSDLALENALQGSDGTTHAEPVPLAPLASERSPVTTAAVPAVGSERDESALLLLVRLESAGGGVLLKKNILTGLGAAPLYHMGGAAVSYLLLDGRDGRVVAGGTVAEHGGYTKASRIAEALGQQGSR